ncbi:docking protein 3 isoform 2-T2 [Alca torda]
MQAARAALLSGSPLGASCALPARVLPHCPSARGRADRRTPPVAQPLPLIPHTEKGKSLREGSQPHAVASAAAVTFSPLLVAQVLDPCAGCQGGAGLMERPVKDGILYVQHCRFGKRSWRKMRAQLFAASPSGVARMEKFDVRDDSTALEKTSLRRCARRVIRLSDCVSVGPAGTESCPKATAAFYLTTTEKSYLLASEQRDEWITQLCHLAFQGAKETMQNSARTQPSPAVPMEENSLYSSWQDRSDRIPGAGGPDGCGHPLWPAWALPALSPSPEPDAEGPAVPAAPAHLALPLPPQVWPGSGWPPQRLW